MTVVRHTAYNIAGAIVPVAIALVTVPLYLHTIGAERYGVLAVCWLLLGYFNLFDLGLGRAVSQRLATLHAASDEDRERLFWTAFWVSVSLSAIGFVLFFPLANLGLRLLNFESSSVAAEITRAYPWLAAALPFGVINGLMLGALEGRRAFLKSNLAFSASTAMTSVFPLIAALVWGPDLWILLSSSLVARGLGVALLFLACRKAVPARRLRKPQVAEARSLLRYGGWTTISNIIGPLLSVGDRFLIGVYVGASAVSAYVIPSGLISQLVVVPSSLASAMFPQLAASNVSDARKLSGNALLSLAFFLTPITIGFIAFAGPFLHLWLGAAVGGQTAPVATILLFGLWANSLARLPLAKLQAGGHPDIVAKIHLSELIPYVGVLYVCLKLYGVAGAALAWSLRTTADTVLLSYFASTSRRVVSILALHVPLILAACACAYWLPFASPTRWVALLAILAISLVVIFRSTPAELLEMKKLALLRILGRWRGVAA